MKKFLEPEITFLSFFDEVSLLEQSSQNTGNILVDGKDLDIGTKQ